MTNFQRLQALRAKLSALQPTTSDVELTERFNDAIELTRLWRILMNEQSRFKTPKPSNIMRHLDSECREVLQLWMKTNLDEPRSRPPNGTEQTEMGHVLAMALTALMAFVFEFHPLETKFLLSCTLDELNFKESEDRTWRDVLCVKSTGALSLFRFHPSGFNPALSDLLRVFGICYLKLGDQFYTQLLTTLDEWAAKWHPAGRIEEVPEGGDGETIIPRPS